MHAPSCSFWVCWSWWSNTQMGQMLAGNAAGNVAPLPVHMLVFLSWQNEGSLSFEANLFPHHMVLPLSPSTDDPFIPYYETARNILECLWRHQIDFLCLLMQDILHSNGSESRSFWVNPVWGQIQQCPLCPANPQSAAVTLGCSVPFSDVCLPHGAHSRGNALWTELGLAALQIPETGSWSRQQGCRKAYWFRSPFVCTPSLVQMLSCIKVKMKYWISEMLKFWISQNFDLFCLFCLDFC